jgi:hypothetical protein
MLLKTKRNDQKNEPERSPNEAIFWAETARFLAARAPFLQADQNA